MPLICYVINYATVDDWECHHEDGGEPDIEELASPRGIMISSLDKLDRGLEVALAEMRESDDEERVQDKLPLPTYTWHRRYDEIPAGADYQCYDLHQDGELFGIAIIRKMEEII